MGYIKHNAIIVTGGKEEILKANKKACKIFKKYLKNNILVSEIIEGLSNGQYSFFIAPDGSKEGWETSQNGDKAREKFCNWLDKKDICDYVEVQFGGDDSNNLITRNNER